MHHEGDNKGDLKYGEDMELSSLDIQSSATSWRQQDANPFWNNKFNYSEEPLIEE